jgi:hypothetical protein
MILATVYYAYNGCLAVQMWPSKVGATLCIKYPTLGLNRVLDNVILSQEVVPRELVGIHIALRH